MSELADVALLFFGTAELTARLWLSRRQSATMDAAGPVVVYGAAFVVAVAVTAELGAAHLAVAAVALGTALACRPALRFLHLSGFLSVVATAQFRVTAV